jgi:hypothetical protein
MEGCFNSLQKIATNVVVKEFFARIISQKIFLSMQPFYRFSIFHANRKSQIANRKSQIANRKSQIANRKSQIANHKSSFI